IELLVVIATITVLIELLLPNVQDVRDAAAQKQIKDSVSATLCDPPYCGVSASVSLQFPAMPGSLTANDVLGSGILLAYDKAGLPNGNVFAIAGSGASGPNVYPVAFASLDNVLTGANYALNGGRYIDSTLYLTVEEQGNPVPLTLAARVSNGTLEIAQSDPVPEPATLLPVLAAGAVFLLRSRRPTAAVATTRLRR
ncbi:MAG TPA: PEP-CTERM sorting domain-containing protein, partial [Bryobacteraceae bacterium]|nr:PEP-CTERM sorting domain-containing protein [Bryobacteraceae bacterium]